jgi:serine/threonine protein kinase
VTVRTRLINRRYRLERRITLAGNTETWLGFDNVLHRAVAVSMPRQEFLRNGPFLVQFLQRSRIATALHHRGIVAAFDSGEDGDTPYLVTEYLGGESLAEIIRAESPFDVDDVAILIEQLADALDYAHQRGFVHGSLTPDDATVDGQGAAKLIGLGLPIGTQASNGDALLTIDRDIAALAAIAFEMLTGEESDAVETGSADEAYLIDPDIPRNASDIVSIGLGAGTARFTSAGAFARSLSAWRAFDPGEFFVTPESTPDSRPEDEALPAAATLLELEPSFEDTDARPSSAPGPPADRRALWAMAAVFVLALVAATIVWNAAEPVSQSPAPIPPRVLELARLTAF